jgi:carbon-monoxide dehydrogenase medium subunit
LRFEYLEPESVEEAISSLAAYGRDAKAIAGGTDLILQIRNKEIKPKFVIDLNSVSGLDYINYDEEAGLRIGALTTIRSLEVSSLIQRSYPVISEAAGQLGSVAIRNMATLGGNLCNGAPSAETAPALIGLSAIAKIVGAGGKKLVPLEQFFAGPGTTILGAGELLAEIQVPVQARNTKAVYLKHTKRDSIGPAIVGVSVLISQDDEACKDVKVVLGAVAPKPMRAYRAEKVIRGRKANDALINRSAQLASEEARPISDVRASAEYRKEMVRVLVQRALRGVMS